MRSTWTGHLGFGLVNIPVSLFKATEDHDVGFHQHHGEGCGGRIRYKRCCEDCGAVVDFGNIVKGIEVDGQTVIITPEDLDMLDDANGKNIEILEFVPANQIDPVFFEGTYYVGSPEGQKAYALLVASMEVGKQMAIAKFALRSKTRMAALRVVDGVLTLHTLRWPDEVRAPEVPGLGGTYTAAELRAAKMLVKSMAGEFKPELYIDEYQRQLQELVAAKAAGVDLDFEPAPGVEPALDDLLGKLEASVAKKTKKAAPRKPRKKAA
jgi:DNA end-binding protein Ku